MIKNVVMLIAVMAISGCAPSAPPKPAPTKSTWSPYDANPEPAQATPMQVAPFKYEPASRQEFIMLERSEKMRKFGYRNFCATATRSSCSPLKYSEYVGKRGYFETVTPIQSERSFDYWAVVFENGERLYYSTLKNKDPFRIAEFIKLEIFERNKAEHEKIKDNPLIPGSSIYIGNSYTIGTIVSYELSNGTNVRAKELKELQKIARLIKPFNDDVLDSLTRMELTIDKVRRIVFVKPMVSGSAGYETRVYLYMAIEDNKTTLRFKLRYHADSWLFVDIFTVAADDYRWTSSGKTRWERDHGSGSIWEWIDIPAGPRLLSLSKRIADATESTIRFNGRQYYKDYEVPEDVKADILKMIRLYQHIK